MEAELFKELTENDRKSVCELVTECNNADHTNYDPELDGDFYYIIRNDDNEESGLDADLFAVLSGYLLGETMDGEQVIEVEAFTHPAMRCIGFFTTCYNSLRDDFRGYRIKFMIKAPLAGHDDTAHTHISFSESNDSTVDFSKEDGITYSGGEGILHSAVPFISPDTFETLHSIGAAHLYDELFMKKTLKSPIKDPGDNLSNQYGEVHLTAYGDDTLYLYGLLVYDKFLGQGHGRALMEAVEHYENGNYKNILLQVSSTNTIALNLYHSMGYEETERIIYFTV
ncbi:GNAT family N-acetyltransferase [Oribacterium sp. WCC10]|uniref:GNAT family N-acetyltransferase n=1 Tax=Oribacterium sp. WCC10 TaxID=1855343 RepID=UPI0008E96EEA|nr:GNAT family N-acetyltransferase [Oribacterium sp. WCC10]SFG31670.1 Acetyltransferase (GNAT) family protein [Oribacterium sp. WCC10]